MTGAAADFMTVNPVGMFFLLVISLLGFVFTGMEARSELRFSS